MLAHKRDARAPLDSLLKQSALITADMPDRSFLSKSWCLRTYNLDFCGERTHNLDRGRGRKRVDTPHQSFLGAILLYPCLTYTSIVKLRAESGWEFEVKLHWYSESMRQFEWMHIRSTKKTFHVLTVLLMGVFPSPK